MQLNSQIVFSCLLLLSRFQVFKSKNGFDSHYRQLVFNRQLTRCPFLWIRQIFFIDFQSHLIADRSRRDEPWVLWERLGKVGLSRWIMHISYQLFSTFSLTLSGCSQFLADKLSNCFPAPFSNQAVPSSSTIFCFFSRPNWRWLTENSRREMRNILPVKVFKNGDCRFVGGTRAGCAFCLVPGGP